MNKPKEERNDKMGVVTMFPHHTDHEGADDPKVSTTQTSRLMRLLMTHDQSLFANLDGAAASKSLA